MKTKLTYSLLLLFVLGSCAGSGNDISDPDAEASDSLNDSIVGDAQSNEIDITTAYRDEGAKMYVSSEDKNAAIHFKSAINDYNLWEIVDAREEAIYLIKLKVDWKKMNREAWITISPIDGGDVLYTSPKAKGITKKLRTSNLKEQAVKNLVHNVLRPEFFD